MTDLPNLALLSLVTALHIGLKATQNLNIINGRYPPIPLVALCLAAVEVYVISTIARRGPGLTIVVAMAIGATIGSWTAMKIQSRKEDRDHGR